MSDSVRPRRWQPTRLPCPWDSPGKNTGVGCHFLLQCRKVKSESEVTQSCPTLRDPMDCSLPGSSIHGIFQARVLEWGAIAFSTSHSYKPSLLSFLHDFHSLCPSFLPQCSLSHSFTNKYTPSSIISARQPYRTTQKRMEFPKHSKLFCCCCC